MPFRDALSCAKVALAAVVLSFSLGSSAAPARVEVCRALHDCIESDSLCVLVQVPRSQQKRIFGSEAFEDMESQVASLQARRADVRYTVVTQDLSQVLYGLKAARTVRTVFLAKEGRALLNAGLYIDDPAPVEVYFSSRMLPETLRGQATPMTLSRRKGACGAKQ